MNTFASPPPPDHRKIHDYPRLMYHQTKPDTHKRVHSKDEELSLDSEWARTPPPEPDPVKVEDPIETLKWQVEALTGIVHEAMARIEALEKKQKK